MALLDTWRNLAYQTEMDNKTANEFWGSYFTQEKAIYEQILADPDTVVKGTVKELADKYGVEVLLMTGFLDGIYKKQKLSGTIVKGKKIGRNDPCPCGSGKKYKQCCGKNA